MTAFTHIVNYCKSEADIKELFDIILTSSEREKVEERLYILHELNEGLSQRKVKDKLNVSIATVTRGAQELKGKPFIKKLFSKTDYFKKNEFFKSENQSN